MADPLLTLDQVAGRLHKHPKTLRKLLPDLMDRMPALRARKLGRTLMFTEHDFNLIVEALAWRSASGSAARTGMRGGRSGLVATRSPSPNSEQEALRELLRSKKASRKRDVSSLSGLTVLPGGRAA